MLLSVTMSSHGSDSTDVPALKSLPPWGSRLRHSIAMAITLVVGSLLLFWVWSRDDEQVAIVELPETERASLYARTLANLQTTCKVQDGSLRAYCEQQARFIVKFPECDPACVQLARTYLPQPTR